LPKQSQVDYKCNSMRLPRPPKADSQRQMIYRCHTRLVCRGCREILSHLSLRGCRRQSPKQSYIRCKIIILKVAPLNLSCFLWVPPLLFSRWYCLTLILKAATIISCKNRGGVNLREILWLKFFQRLHIESSEKIDFSHRGTEGPELSIRKPGKKPDSGFLGLLVSL